MTMSAVRPHRTRVAEFPAAHITLKLPPPSPVAIPDVLGLGSAEEEQRIIAVQKSGRWLLEVAYLYNTTMGLFLKIAFQGLTPLVPL